MHWKALFTAADVDRIVGLPGFTEDLIALGFIQPTMVDGEPKFTTTDIAVALTHLAVEITGLVQDMERRMNTPGTHDRLLRETLEADPVGSTGLVPPDAERSERIAPAEAAPVERPSQRDALLAKLWPDLSKMPVS